MGRLTHRTSPACTFFVTAKTWQNRALLQIPEVAEVVVKRLFACRDRAAYLLHEFVVTPDHFHLLLTPAYTITLEKAMQLIKGGSWHEIYVVRRHRMQIWQPGFHDWTVRDVADYHAKRGYIQTNFVRANLARHPADRLYGSASGKFPFDRMPEGIQKASGAEASRITGT
ncbi:MAG: REP-associated tyrosine transposase [Terriglobia bacterium]